MLGAIIGDIVGSIYEFDNYKAKDFPFFDEGMRITDDSAMTIAVAKALLESKPDYSDLSKKTVEWMQEIGRRYPDLGYGGSFSWWLEQDEPQPYNSWGNGSAMRVSAVAYVAESLDEVKKLSKMVTEVTHNHPEGLKGAEATAVAVWMALHGYTKPEMHACLKEYYYFDYKIDDLRPVYGFKVSCQGTMPAALAAFFEGESYEDAIRNAISLGGDSDTIGAITGAIAEAYWGIPEKLPAKAISYIPQDLLEIVSEFEKHYPGNIV